MFHSAGLAWGKNLSCRIGRLAHKTDFLRVQCGGVFGQRAKFFNSPNQGDNAAGQSLNGANFYPIFARVRSGFPLEMARKLTSSLCPYLDLQLPPPNPLMNSSDALLRLHFP